MAQNRRLKRIKRRPIDVWWDWENAGVPYDLHPSKVYGQFVKKLGEEGFTGRVNIRAFVGYEDSMSSKMRKALCEGENLKIITANKFKRPPGSRDNQASDLEIKESIDMWLKEGHEPQNVMIVSGDNGFSKHLRKLQKAGHTTLAAFREVAGEVTSAQILRFSILQWNWRIFLDLPLKTISKKIRNAQFKERKRLVAVGRERLLQRIIDRDMFEVEVPGDGNCQFGALASQLYGFSELHEEVRRQIVQHLEENRPIYEEFVTMDYNQYCINMARLGEWGDAVTLKAAADLFVVKIRLVTSHEGEGLVRINPREGRRRRVLWLSYLAEQHYNSLVYN